MTALGPSSSFSNPSSLLPAVARRASVFFTTDIRRPFSRSRRRMPCVLLPSIPRGLMTATESRSFKRPVSSLVIRFLTCLLMFQSSACASAHGQLHRRRHRAFDHDFLEVRALARLRLHLANLVDHRVDVVDQLVLLEA